MRDSLGGTVVLMIIVVFIVLVSGYMAFNVNYTKAFRMKNKIVDSYNKFGDCCRSTGSVCDNEITEYAESIGYNPLSLSCDGSNAGLYCVEEHEKTSAGGDLVDANDGHYYTITTKVDINIIFVNKALGLRFLNVRGDTKTFPKGSSLNCK